MESVMKRIIVNESQRGLLFKNGKLKKLLDPGCYRVFGGREIELYGFGKPMISERISVDALASNSEIMAKCTKVEVGERQVALHIINGRLVELLSTGRYVYWNGAEKHEFKIVDATSPYISEDMLKYIPQKCASNNYYKRVAIAEYQKGVLFFDGRFEKVLESGVYYFWQFATDVNVREIDMRYTQMNISGQDMLTLDKVAVRINFVCNYRVIDPQRFVTEVEDGVEQLRSSAQLALREYVGKMRFEELLEAKDAMSQFVLERLNARRDQLFIGVSEVGIKDIILPGDIREIMNTVLIAEKRAQANVITRREEVASTRSLLNTAKLMDENRTLYRLKELEYIERICENVESININGSGDVLAQLGKLLAPSEVCARASDDRNNT